MTGGGASRQTPPSYVVLAQTLRPDQPWIVAGLTWDLFDAAEACGQLHGVRVLIAEIRVMADFHRGSRHESDR